MDIYSIIATIGLIVAVLFAIIFIIVRRHGKNVTFKSFTELYKTQLLGVIKDAIELLKIDSDNYTDRHDYEDAIITTTLEKIKENYIDFGIDEKLVSKINVSGWGKIIHQILDGNCKEIFENIDRAWLKDHAHLLSDKVIELFLDSVTDEEE